MFPIVTPSHTRANNARQFFVFARWEFVEQEAGAGLFDASGFADLGFGVGQFGGVLDSAFKFCLPLPNYNDGKAPEHYRRYLPHLY